MTALNRYKALKKDERVLTALEGIYTYGLFENTLESLPVGGKLVTYEKQTSNVGLESWEDLTYKTDSGDEIKIPKAMLDFKHFVEKEQKEKTINIDYRTSTLRFNPALDGGKITSVKGDTYKGHDCKYLIPVFSFEVMTTYKIGNIYYTTTVPVMAVLNCDPDDTKYGYLAAFTVGGGVKFNNMSLKDHWGFFKWFQPSFDIKSDNLVSEFTTLWDKLKNFFSKVGSKIKGLFGSKEITEEQAKELQAK